MIRFWTILGLTALVTCVLAYVARRLGWGDAATGPAAERKLQRSPVPPVGGLAIVIAYSLYTGFAPERGWREVFLLVLLVGAIDDGLARGLSPLAKLALQAPEVLDTLGRGGANLLVGNRVADADVHNFNHLHAFMRFKRKCE